MTAPYDDPQFSYPKYWIGRQYEHQSEVTAISTLLKKRQFSKICDLGGGYGRLTPHLYNFSNSVVLVEPSAKQRQMARKRLSAQFPRLEIKSGSSSKTSLPTESVDLVTLVRVLHHIPDPRPTLVEIRRILRPRGLLILEFANSQNFKSLLLGFLAHRPVSTAPIEKRSPANVRRRTIPFVNHHPRSILHQLSDSGLTPVKILSVSNLRNPFFKNSLPPAILNFLEKILQPVLAAFYFGPSIFILAQKQPDVDNY